MASGMLLLSSHWQSRLILLVVVVIDCSKSCALYNLLDDSHFILI